ncbi:MAG: phage terminase large subunit family protein [Syntrophus sp. (in: bacteria)]
MKVELTPFVIDHVIDGAMIYHEAFNNGLRPDQDLTVTEWADTHRMLPKKSSAEPGKYRSSRTPYVREIMDALSPSSRVSEIVVMKGTQLGFTELGNNWFGYVADVSPGPMMMIFPTSELAKDHSKQKLQPTIQETPRLKDKVKEHRTRDSGNTIQTKEFPGGILFLSGSNSGAFFRSKSIRFLFLDDIDGFDHDIGGEGDPADLAKKRTDTFGRRKKIMEVSTPTTKGISRIERSFLESDHRYYHVPCPDCGEYQRLLWGGPGADFGLKFTRDEHGKAVDVWYECAACHKQIDEHNKADMLEKGRWIPTYPERQKCGYQISSLYSPLGWVSWLQIVKEFMEAKAFKERLKTWVNTRLGETFEETGDQPDWSLLQARCEPYEILTVPMGGLFLTAGVDTQDNRLAVVVRAWGRGEESWLIYWNEIYGDPAQPTVWSDLDSLLSRPFNHAGGNDLNIVSAAIDTGGHHTQEVYSFCHRKHPMAIAIKGASQTGKPIIGHPTLQDVTWQGQKIPNGVQLWPIGTDTAKATIYSRLKIQKAGPGCYHFPIEIDGDYFIQLTAEKLLTRYVKGFPRLEWVMTGPRNEALDCEVYCYAAAIRAGIVHVNWESLEKSVCNNTSEPEAVNEHPSAKPRNIAKSKWMNRSNRW